MNDAPSYTTELDEVIQKFEYNTNGQLTKEINPSGTTVSYTYDKTGNLISKKDEDGYVTNNTYDSVNNLTQVKYDSGKTVSYTYNPNNQITSMTDWLGTNTYDLEGQMRCKKATKKADKTCLTSVNDLSIIDNATKKPHKIILTCGCSSVVEPQPSKLVVRVRFPSPAPQASGLKTWGFFVA